MGSLLIVLCHSHHATRGPGWAWALTWKPLWHGHSLDSGTRATAWQMHFLGRNAFKLQFSIFQHSPEATLQQVNFDVNIETPGEPLLFSASPGSHNYHSLEGSLPWTKLLSWQSLLLAKCFSTKENQHILPSEEYGCLYGKINQEMFSACSSEITCMCFGQCQKYLLPHYFTWNF